MTLTQEQIEKYRRLAKSTNTLAAETAKKKLADAGVPLEEPAKKEEAKKEDKPKETPKEEKKEESSSKESFDSYSKKAIRDYRKKIGAEKSTPESEILPEQVKKVMKEGYNEDWSNGIVVNEMAKIYRSLKKHKDEGKPEDEFDCDTLIAKAKALKAKQKRAYEKKKNAPKKTEATKAKEKIEGVNKGVEKRASKGKVTLSEIDKLIMEYESAIKKLKGLRAKIKKGEKMAKGGDVDSDNKHYDSFMTIKEHTCPCQEKKKMAKGGKVEIVDLFEDYNNIPEKIQAIFTKYQEKFGEDYSGMDYDDTQKMLSEVEKHGYTFDYGLDNEPIGLRKKGVKLNQLKGYEDEAMYGQGGEIEDKKYSAEKAGLRHSKKYASVEMRGGKVYHRRNANQYGKAKGGKTYTENRDNRSDKRKYFERGGSVKYGYHGTGLMAKKLWLSENFIGKNKVSLGDLKSHLEKELNKDLSKEQVMIITRKLYKIGYRLDDKKDWKQTMIYSLI